MTDQEFQKIVIEHLVKLTESQEHLQQNLAKIEFIQSEKLSALFDGYQSLRDNQNAMLDTLKDQTLRLERIEEKHHNT